MSDLDLLGLKSDHRRLTRDEKVDILFDHHMYLLRRRSEWGRVLKLCSVFATSGAGLVALVQFFLTWRQH